MPPIAPAPAPRAGRRTARGRGRASLLAAAAAFLPSASSAAPPPRCAVALALEPGRAFVGQQVLYQLRILRRRDVSSVEWHEPLVFPTFRVEWLPGVAGEGRVEEQGETYLVFHERRALFPAHPGRLRIPGGSLRCGSADGEELAVVPPAEIEVDPHPQAGRPVGFTGLVGPVEIDASLAPARVALGESVRLSVVVHGRGNVWEVPSLRAALESIPEVEVFERPPEIARDTGRDVVLRRHLAYDLVPHASGSLLIPELRVAYFDPEARRYAEARARVEPVPVGEAPARTAAAARPASREPGEPRRRSRVPALAAALLAACALALLLRLHRARRAAPRGDALREAERSLATAREAVALGDAEAAAASLARALRAALARAAPGPAALDAEELLARVDRARFARGAELPRVVEVTEAIARLLRRDR